MASSTLGSYPFGMLALERSRQSRAGGFANAALLALVRSALGEATQPRPRPTGARVPASEMRSTLERGLREHGVGALVGIGQRIRPSRFHPLLEVMKYAKSPRDVIEKWTRYERYWHASNRVDANFVDERELVFRRYSKTRTPPSDGENLLIIGLLVALLQQHGCIGVRASVATRDGAVEVFPIHTELLATRVRNQTSRGSIRWRALRKSPLHKCLARPVANHRAKKPGWVHAARQFLAADVARCWSIAQLAAELGVHPRTLQRHLSAADSGFSPLVREVRSRAAAELLADPRWNLSSIGFLCGYSDAAHFSRDFQRALGLPPSAFRKGLA